MLWIWIALGALLVVVLIRGVKAFSKPNLGELMEVARQYRSSGRFVEAAVILRKGRVAYPDNVDLSREHVALLVESKRYADAERLKAEHLKRWPEDTMVRELRVG